MGGRGASSGAKGGKTGIGGGIGAPGKGGKPLPFIDLTANYSGMGLHDFENSIRSEKYEHIGVFDSSGKLIVAGTSRNTGSVAPPVLPAGLDTSTLTVTHNHPSGGDRGIGGTFSPADVSMLARKGYGQIRAVGNGKSEHTYIMRKTANANSAGLLSAANSAKPTMKAIGNRTLKAVQTKLSGSGKSLTPAQSSAIFLGAMKNYWKGVASNNGYEYITLKKAPW